MENHFRILISAVVCAGLGSFVPRASSQSDERVASRTQSAASSKSLYEDDVRFNQLSGAARTLLELEQGSKNLPFGKRPPKPSPSFSVPLTAEQLLAEPLFLFGNVLVNDPDADATAQDTQSETTLVLGPGATIVCSFNDSGSLLDGPHFTGFSRSSDGGQSWTDLGSLLSSREGDGGDPVLARDTASGTIYLVTLGFNSFERLQVFRSFDDGATVEQPINGTPGFTGTGDFQDKPWMAVDNFAGPGQGNVYIAWRNFANFGTGSGVSHGIRFNRSTDGGATFSPNKGILIASEGGFNVQGAFVTVGPDHAVYVFWLDQSAGFFTPNLVKVCKSTDLGVTFGPAITIAALDNFEVNGDLGLEFRSNSFPQAGVNPINGDIYVVFADNPEGLDRGDIFFTRGTQGGPVSTSLVFQARFESGLNGFTIDSNLGVGGGLWHRTVGRGAQDGHSASHSLYYGQGEGTNGGGNYDDGNTEGVVTSSTIDLTSLSGTITLSFNYFLETEQFVGVDLAIVEVSINGGEFIPVASNYAGPLQDPSGGWVAASVDLSRFAGAEIRVRFHFATLDEQFNEFEGWYIDDIRIIRTTGGLTWTPPVRVNNDLTTRDQWQPALAVTPNGSKLFVGWYDRRKDSANSQIDLFGAIGDVDLGGGSGGAVTFRCNFRVNNQSFPAVFGQDPAVNFTYMGDYDQAVADNSFFYYTWGDNGLANPFHANQPDVRFAKIPFTGPATTNLIFQDLVVTGGNGNGIIDANECNGLRIVIANDGCARATSLVGTLATSTPEVTILDATSAYPDIAAGASASNATAFRISTSPDFVCGTPIDLTLTLEHAGGSDTIDLPVPPSGADYIVSQATGASIVPGTTDVGIHCDDCTAFITLPFAYTLYGRNFTEAVLSSNGNLQFLSDNASFFNTCLPFTGFNYAILAHWNDLFDGGDDDGVFTSVSGVAPNRIFNIEWRRARSLPVHFEVRLYEGQQKFDLIYGSVPEAGVGATVGVQEGDGSSFTQFECNEGGLADGLRLTFEIPPCAPNPGSIVNITAIDSNASELGSNTGRIKVSRTGGCLDLPLRVPYTVGGTATPGIDYSNLTAVATISAGASDAFFNVKPIDDAVGECAETVIATLSPQAAYRIGPSSSATVTIADNDQPVVTVIATDSIASEAGANTGRFTVRRVGCTESPLRVFYTLGGTATRGLDYSNLVTSVTIATNKTTAPIVIAPINDSVPENPETVILRILSGSGYVLGVSSNAAVIINDND